MAEKKHETSQDAEPPFRHEIRLGGQDSASDWMSLLGELRETPEKPSSSAKKKDEGGDSDREAKAEHKSDAGEETRASEDSDRRRRARARYEELCNKPSMKIERADMMVMSEFSDIIGDINKLGKILTRLRDKYPEYLRLRQHQTCIDNLKETSQVMLHEFHNLRHGRSEKKYDKRYVCVNCHQVFMVPLPPDRVCDECRAERTPTNAPY